MNTVKEHTRTTSRKLKSSKQKMDRHVVLGLISPVMCNGLISMLWDQAGAGASESCLSRHINPARSCSEGEAPLSAVNAFSQRWCVDPNSEGLAGCVIVACSLRLILLSGFLGDIMCLPAEQRWAGRRKGGGEGTAGAALPSGSGSSLSLQLTGVIGPHWILSLSLKFSPFFLLPH